MTTVQLVYPEGKNKAATFNYDDGSHADERLVALFNRHKLKATFNICSSWLDKPGYCASQELLARYAGHEVACHSVTHPTMTRLAKEALVSELIDNRQALESLVGTPIKGFAYPNGAYDEQLTSLLPFVGIDYARVASSSNHFHLPSNWYEWQPTAHHNDDLYAKCEQFTQLNKSQYLFLMHVWGHSYEFDRDQTWETFEQCCRLLSEQQDVWFVTCGQFYDYMLRFKGLKFTADSKIVYNPYADSVWLKLEDCIIEAKAGTATVLSK